MIIIINSKYKMNYIDEKPSIDIKLTIKIPPDTTNYPRISKCDFFSTPLQKKDISDVISDKNLKRKREHD